MRSVEFRQRSRLRSGVSTSALAIGGLALLLGMVSPAIAQGTQTPSVSGESDVLEEIIVTGIRRSLEQALSAKRDAAQVLDAISAEDVGKFPDKNIGEALQRITGVQISRTNGEGATVSIRGADPSLNRVEVNGTSALSTTVGGGRDVDFRDMPVEFINRLEVVKSVTPEMTEGGLGGTVRIITRRPFDSDEPFVAGSLQTIWSETAEKFDPKAAIIGGTTLANDTVGVVLGATYENRHVSTHEARTTGWRQIGDLNGNGIKEFAPDIPRYVINRLETERVALNGAVEWRPTDTFSLGIDGNYAKGKQDVNSQFLQFATAGSESLVDKSKTTVGPDNTVSHIEFVNNPALAQGQQLTGSYRNILGTLTRTQWNTAINSKWEATENLTLTARGSYAHARAFNDEINAVGDVIGLSRLVVDYTNSKHAPDIRVNFDPTTPAGLNQLTLSHKPRINDQDEWDGKFDAEYKFDGGFITAVKAGFQIRTLTADSRYYSSSKVLNGFANPSLLGQIQQIVGSNATLGDVPFFKTGSLGFDPSITRWLNLGDGVVEAGGLLDPYGSPQYLDSWEVTEKNRASYIQASFAFDALVPVSGVVGVRSVNTRTTSKGYSQNKNAASEISYAPVEYNGEYTKYLPALNLKFDLIPEKLQGRVTATKVLARPTPQQLAPRRTLDTVGNIGSRGNPNLKPYEASQYDIGLEYYLNRTDFFSATYFRKEISSFIQNTTVNEVVDGVTYGVIIPSNGTEKVTINGLEAGVQYGLGFLPAPFNNMGVIANYTFSDDSGYQGMDKFTGEKLSFIGLSRNSYNLSAYYEDEAFSARVSYNWRSKYLITAVGRGGNPEFGEAFGQLDGSVSYNITDQYSVFLEAVNILDATRVENANSEYRRTIFDTFGRRIYAGVRARF